MEDKEIFEKLSAGFKGKTMAFTRSNGRQDVTKIIEIKPKGHADAIFVGEGFSVGFFAPLHIFSLIKEETDSGWVSGDLLDEITIGKIPFHQAVRFVLDGHDS